MSRAVSPAQSPGPNRRCRRAAMSAAESPSNAGTRSAGPGSASLETRSGVRLDIRPARPKDEDRLADFFRHVAPADLRFRFLSPLRQVRAAQVHELIDVD